MSVSDIEILAHENTPLGWLCLRRRELLGDPGTFVTEITLDHELLMSSLHTASERALARLALAEHSGRDLRVFIGGLGLGYTAQEVLRADRVARVDVVELLPQVIDWLSRDWLPLGPELRADPRFHAIEGDAYAQLLAPPAEPFDLILVDIDHSPDDRLGRVSDRFYTEAGIAATKRHLAPGGVLAVWSYEESSPYAEMLRRGFRTVRVEGVEFENTLIDTVETDWIFIGHDRD